MDKVRSIFDHTYIHLFKWFKRINYHYKSEIINTKNGRGQEMSSVHVSSIVCRVNFFNRCCVKTIGNRIRYTILKSVCGSHGRAMAVLNFSQLYCSTNCCISIVMKILVGFAKAGIFNQFRLYSCMLYVAGSVCSWNRLDNKQNSFQVGGISMGECKESFPWY